MNKKIPVLLTIAIMIIGIFAAVALIYLPGSDAPQVSFTLYDSDGVKSVAPGETAEYVIRVENTGQTTGHYTLAAEGEADGWTSSISHESLHLQAGDHRLVSLYVTPEDEQAEPRIDVNVVATRADNVTIVSTSTYLTGSVHIREADDTFWKTFVPGSGMGEGDNLKTGHNSYVQVDFGDSLFMSLLPESEIHSRFSNEANGVTTLWFDLTRGSVAFKVMLPNDQSSFTLTIADGSRVTITSDETTIFRAHESGRVEVLQGGLLYEGPPTRSTVGTRAGTQIDLGMDSLGNSFEFSIISVPREKVNALITNGRIGTMGFDNSDSFTADGNLNAFLFREGSLDRLFIFGADSVFTELSISQEGEDPFDVTSVHYDPEPSTFSFENITTTSRSVFIRFEPDIAYISPSSDATYDMKITNAEGETHTTSDIPVKAAQGNSFEVEDFGTIDEPDSDSVMFGLDKNGDEVPEQTTFVASGLNGEDIIDDLPTKDDDEDSKEIWIALVIVLVVVAIVVLIIYNGKGGFGGGRTKMAREEEFAQKRAEYLRAQEARKTQSDESAKPGSEPTDKEDGGDSWDELIEKDAGDKGEEPVAPLTGPEPVLGAREFTPGSVSTDEQPQEPDSWAPQMPETEGPDMIGDQLGMTGEQPDVEPEVPPHLTDFGRNLDSQEYQEIDKILATPSVGADFTDPGIMRKKVEKEIDEIDEWWDGWNEELDDILKN